MHVWNRAVRLSARTLIAAAVALTALALDATARADGWPTSVAGTWPALANNTSGTLTLTQTATSGNCVPISGFLLGNTVEGFYCRFSGRIGFVRKTSGGVPFQYFEGQLNQNSGTRRMTGEFYEWPGSGAYSFQAFQ